MQASDIKRLRELEDENRRLKQMSADGRLTDLLNQAILPFPQFTYLQATELKIIMLGSPTVGGR